MNAIHTTLPRLSLILVLTLLGSACASPSSRGGMDEATQNERRGASHYNLGVGNLQAGRVALAIRDLRIAEGLRPKDRWTQLALAEAYRRKALWEKCEQHLLKALDLAPGFQQARLTLSAVYIEMGRFAESAQLAGMLVEDPTFPLPWAALTNQEYLARVDWAAVFSTAAE